MKPFSSKYQTFGQGQTIWADKFLGIWGTFVRFVGTHFGTVSPLSLFSNNQPLFLQKTKLLYPNPKYWDWDLNLHLGRKKSMDLAIVCP